MDRHDPQLAHHILELALHLSPPLHVRDPGIRTVIPSRESCSIVRPCLRQDGRLQDKPSADNLP